MSSLSNNEVVKKTYIARTPNQVAGFLVEGFGDLVSPAVISMSMALLGKVCKAVATDYGSSDPSGMKALQMAIEQKKLLSKVFLLDETTQDCAKLADFSTNNCVIVRYDPL